MKRVLSSDIENFENEMKKNKFSNIFEDLSLETIQDLGQSKGLEKYFKFLEVFLYAQKLSEKGQCKIESFKILDGTVDLFASCIDDTDYKISISFQNGKLGSNCTCQEEKDKFCCHKIASLITVYEKNKSVSPLGSPILENVEFPGQWKERNDRQLRLWGLHGQKRIDEANVLLLNASVVGSEVLKNIVLPGFGKFAIVDDRKVTIRDLGKNFFVTMDGLGQSLAQNVCQNLAELNPDVQGNYLVESPDTVINDQPQFLDDYNYIIASNMDTKTVSKLAQICWEKNKTLIVCRCYGMIGYIRTIVKTHEVVEGKLDNLQDDLRLCQPWDSLVKYCENINFEKMNFKDHCHTPWIIILLKFLEKFQKEFNKKYPETDEEKMEFENWIKQEEKNAINKRQKEIESMEEVPQEYLASNEENFQEALNNIFFAWTPHEIDDEIKSILSNSKSINLTKDSSDFWFLVNGLKKFIENEGQGCLPLNGKIPDMQSDTERYIQLQNLYRKKSKEDLKILKKYVNQELKKYSRENTITDYDFNEFCINIQQIRYFEFKSFQDELNPLKSDIKSIQSELQDPDSNLIYYFLLRSVDIFNEKFKFYPGTSKEENEKETFENLKEILISLLKDYSCDKLEFNNLSDYIHEMIRFGASEIHNISSLVGGVGGQELIKLCTKQRLPFINTWIFDGIKSVSKVYNL